MMSKTRAAIWIGLLVALLALPQLLTSYYLALATKMLIFALFAMSLDLVLGYAGMASLGHAAFFGIASYTVALLMLRAELDPWVAFLAGILASGITGALFGLLALRTRGSYFLMITLALGQVVWGIAFGWRTMTGGDDGLPNVPRPSLGSLSFLDSIPFYYLVLLLTGVAAAILVCIVRSPFGYALRGIRESESRMAALGYDVWLYKYLAFVLAALFAGVAGGLYVFYNRFVSLDYLHVIRSAEGLLMVILGGAGTLIGPAFGAGLIVLLENLISSYTERWLLVLGLIYVVVTLFAPRGLAGLVERLWPRRSRL